MKIKFLIPILSLLLLVSCKPFVASKDAAQQVAKLNAKVETNDMYNLMVSGTKSYSAYEQRYTSIATQIENITAADSVRKNAGDLFKQDKLVREAWASRWAYHKSKGTLKPAEVNSEQQYMKSYWDAVMRAELSLK